MKRVLHPAALMAVVWVGAILLFYGSPITYVHAPGAVAWSIMGGGVLLFGLGAVAGERVPWTSRRPLRGELSLDRLVLVCAALGFIGIAAMLIDKFLLSDIDWSGGISAARERRAIDVVNNVPIRRTGLLYLGYLTMSFSCVALGAFILTGERLRRLASVCGQISVLPMALYAVLYGGRMPILLVILLVVGSGFVRLLQGKPFLPAGHAMWWKLAALAIALLIYTNTIWESRRQANRIVNYQLFVQVAASRWELSSSPWLDRAIRDGRVPATRAMDWISIDLYLTHPPTTVQRMVEHWGELSIYGGLYQIGILSPISDIVAPGLRLPQKMRAELAAAGIYGWFPSAWGAWIGDAGLIGGAICVLIWGLLSGLAYRLVRKNGSFAAQLMLSFAYLAILVSPLSGPFGLANAFLIFGSFAATSFVVATSERRKP